MPMPVAGVLYSQISLGLWGCLLVIFLLLILKDSFSIFSISFYFVIDCLLLKTKVGEKTEMFWKYLGSWFESQQGPSHSISFEGYKDWIFMDMAFVRHVGFKPKNWGNTHLLIMMPKFILNWILVPMWNDLKIEIIWSFFHEVGLVIFCRNNVLICVHNENNNFYFTLSFIFHWFCYHFLVWFIDACYYHGCLVVNIVYHVNWFRMFLQSRVGPVEWLKPYTDETIIDLGKKGVKNLLAVPIRYLML